MDQVKKKLGFGCMRLPMKADGRVDTAELSRMVDIFLENGFNYFDTALELKEEGKNDTSGSRSMTGRLCWISCGEVARQAMPYALQPGSRA